MKHYTQHFIGGEWVESEGQRAFEMVNPTTEMPFATMALASAYDVDQAVAAAKSAFDQFSSSSVDERISLFERIIVAYTQHIEALRQAVAEEVGCPISASVQVMGPLDHFRQAITTLQSYEFEKPLGTTTIRREAIGVCGLISPWNWPLQTPSVKIASAFAAGCPVVLKPSEFSTSSAIALARVLEDAGVPPGAFNLIIGDGGEAGSALCAHPDVDLVSFTGSTRAGILVAQTAALTVKRVAQELGGKSANVVLRDADLAAAARWNASRAFFNSGQSCHAPSRILVHRSQENEFLDHLIRAAGNIRIGQPLDPQTEMGPVVNKAQYDRIQNFIGIGTEEGAQLVHGGLGRPDGFSAGYFVKPTIFAGVSPTSTIAQEEIFGPVLTVSTYEDEDEAVDIANGTKYGLGGYLFSGSPERAKQVANRIRAGRVFINGAPGNSASPMGGYKQSGNGREMGIFGLEEFLETKAIFGHAA